MSSGSEVSIRLDGPNASAMEDDLVIDKKDMCDEYKDVLLQAGNPLVGVL